MTQPWIAPGTGLAGKHVRLVPMEEAHIPGLFRAGADPEVWKFVPFRVRTEEDMRTYVRQALADRDKGEAYPFATLTGEGRIIGSTRFYTLAPAHKNLEIGYTWLDPAHWRTAANTEAKSLMLAFAFETLGCQRVALRTDMLNLRSQRAMERFGAAREGVFRKHMILPDGRIRDTVYYSVTDAEWPKAKAFFAAALARPSG